ncbi:hypothetical protein DFH06DRAFT_1142425 [Mycena polygramma]|nr:hypothetical protein DFH06DRAFT_1142425 [Mycena polygramma]
MDPNAPENTSRATAEFYSAHSGPDQPAVESTNDSTAHGPGSSSDVALQAAEFHFPGPLSSTRRASSASRAQVKVVMHRDERGNPFLVDREGYTVRLTQSAMGRSATSSSEDNNSGVPMHPHSLFGLQAATSSPPPRAYHQVSPPPVAYESMLGPEAAISHPPLDLDIDPDILTGEQIGQLNAIRAHLGTANTRLTASTAIIAEQQAATEDIHDAIQVARLEAVSRLDSLKDEVNSQRARLNRCLDDNLRTLKDNGASTSQVNELLEILNRNQGAHRLPRIVPHENITASMASVPLPSEVLSSVGAVIPPRAPHETADDFERRADAVLRTKEKVHQAFPLPALPRSDEQDLRRERDRERDPLTQHHTILNSRHPASVVRSRREIERLEGLRPPGISHARFEDGISSISMRDQGGLGASISGYHSAVVDGRDVMNDFADDMSDIIRTTIEHRIGKRIELPPHVRPAKIDNRARYGGQDDHEVFMTTLEKFLGWMRTCGYGGPELDTYRISLLSGVFLEGDALQWFTTEVDNPRYPGRNQLDFTEIICALHRRYVKSASAQRATRAFEAVRYDPATGPEKFMSNMILRGQAMVEMPSDFLLKDRFLKGIPNWLSKELKMRRGVTSEFTGLAFIRQNARQLWESDLAMRDEEASKAKSPVPFVARPSTNTPRTTPYRTNDTSRTARPVPPAAPTAPRPTPTRETPVVRRENKGCFTCGGTDHFAKDRSCPRYSERDITRERPRVAAQRVEESYSDEDRGPFSDYENEEALLSEEEDPQASPDLDDLIAAADERDQRFGAMRAPLHYYSMRIVEDDNQDSAEDTAESGAPLAEIPGLLSPLRDTSPLPETIPLGNYNPGPLCVVCHGCSLVIRRVPATPENGLPVDGEYTVCEHLRNVGLDPAWVALPASPRITSVPLPPVSETDGGADTEPPFDPASRINRASTRDLVFRGYPANPPPFRTVNADGDLLNEMGDPDLPSGVLIDVTNIPDDGQFQSAEEEVAAFDQEHRLRGLRPYTAHEYDVNVRHLRRYRFYEDQDGAEAQRLRNWSEYQNEQLREDPDFGAQFRAREAITVETDACLAEGRINLHGAGVSYEAEPAQLVLQSELGDRALLHHLTMQWQYRRTASIRTRRLLDEAEQRYEEIQRELDLEHEPIADRLWIRARTHNIHLSARLSYHLAELKGIIESLEMERAVERGRLEMLTQSEDIAEATPIPDDEALFWDALPIQFSTEELLTTPLPDTAPDGNPGQRSEDSFASGRIESIPNLNIPAERPADEHNVLVEESYDATLLNAPVQPSDTDEIIVRSVIMTGTNEAERADIMVDRHNNVYVRTSELPDHHYLNPSFRPIHEAAMDTARVERRIAGNHDHYLLLYSSLPGPNWPLRRDRRGFADCEPYLLPGVAFHERLASLGPDEDNENALPGFRVQFLAGRVEYSSTVRKPELRKGGAGRRELDMRYQRRIRRRAAGAYTNTN